MNSAQAASLAPIPARHGRGLEQAKKIGRLLRMIAGGANADPTPEEWERAERRLSA